MTVEHPGIICKNCFQSLDESFEYCPFCSQKVNIRRLDLKWLFMELITQLSNLESGFVFTCREMFLHPGKTVKKYVNGQRIKYYNPLKFLFLITLIYFSVSFLSGYENNDKDFNVNVSVKEEDIKSNDKMVNSINQFFDSFNKYMDNHSDDLNSETAFMNLLTSVPISIISFLILRKKGYTWTEHIVLYIFLSSQSVLFSTFLIAFYIYFPVLTTASLDSYILGIYYVWGIKEFFELSWIKAIGKSIVIGVSFTFLLIAMFLTWFALLYFLGFV